MNFRHQSTRRHNDDIVMDFIPLIDVLLVVLIFITATTTFSHTQEMPVQLPSTSQQHVAQDSQILAISQEGQYALNGRFLSQDSNSLSDALNALKNKDALLIYADENTRHSAVVRALESARQAHFEKISFATQH